MAKYRNADIPAHVISRWISTRFTIEFMGIWELDNNTYFKLTDFREFKDEAGSQSFTMSPEQWTSRTNTIALINQDNRSQMLLKDLGEVSQSEAYSWYKVQLPDGQIGYVRTDLVQEN